MTIKQQGKGSATRVLWQFETSPGVAPAFASRRLFNIPFNTRELTAQRSLQKANTIRGDRNPVEPFQGNLDVSGNVTIPIDAALFGLILKAAFGQAVWTKDAPHSSDVLVGAPTLTIASGEGTFSVAQTAAAEGDRVIYTDGSSIFSAYLTAETSDTVWDVDTVRAGSSDAADIVAATVLHIVRNSGHATIGTIAIASNVATFSATHPLLAAGAMVIYAGTKRARIVSVLTATTALLEGPMGDSVADEGSPVAVESIELDALFRHRFEIHPRNSLPTLTLEAGYLDLSVPWFERFTGLKVNSIETPMGGDGEFLCTVNLMGAQSVQGYQPFDKADHFTPGATLDISGAGGTFSAAQASSAVGDNVVFIDANGEEQLAVISAKGSDTAVTFAAAPGDGTGLAIRAIYPSADAASIARSRFSDRFQNFDVATYLDGEEISLLKETSLTFSNQLDGEGYRMGGRGTRGDIPEGIAAVSGSLSAVFDSQKLVAKAKAFSTLALDLLFTREETGRSIRYLIPEAKLQEKSPAVPGPAGLMFDPTFEAFKRDGASALVVELTGPEFSY